MGRNKRYRNRTRYEMESVRTKGIRHHLSQLLRDEFGKSKMESEILSIRSVQWLKQLGFGQLPGQVWMSAPATASKKFCRSRRCEVLITAVDTESDTRVWEEFGLAAMQRRRILRWITEIDRQGGWASLKELAAWANMTPTALGNRLQPVRELGVYLPHVGVGAREKGQLHLEPYLVQCYLSADQVEQTRRTVGLTRGEYENILRGFVTIWRMHLAGKSAEEISEQVQPSSAEVEELLCLGVQNRDSSRLTDLMSAYSEEQPYDSSPCGDMERQLKEEFGFSPMEARLYREELTRLTDKMSPGRLNTGEVVYFAISADEGATAVLDEAQLVPVRLTYYDSEDRQRGPRSDSPTKVSDLKFGRVVRYASQARSQGALLTLPDLAVLNGIHVDVIRRLQSEHPEVVVPTRGRVKDIGRGVSHKVEIVELYLQMYTETEICERTGHSYPSIEEYLRQFTQVMTLADEGMNAVMIRRVTGRSMALVEAYLELYRKYDQPDYHFRLAQMRRVFVRDEGKLKRGFKPFHCEDGLP